MTPLDNKIAIVTGGAQGLGEGAVKSLSRAGAKVILTDLNPAVGADTAEKYGADFVEHDVREESQWEQLMSDAHTHYGRVDILVNNAGIFFSCPMDETPVEDFRNLMDINVTGVFLGCKHAVRMMKKNPDGSSGSIINLSSVTGLRGQIGGAAYTASKGAVRLLTKSVAVENAAHGIRCNSIHPGVMRTPMLDALLESAGEDAASAMEAHLKSNLPIGEFGTAQDIGEMVAFLASDSSRYVTGAELVVDGGMTTGLPS